MVLSQMGEGCGGGIKEQEEERKCHFVFWERGGQKGRYRWKNLWKLVEDFSSKNPSIESNLSNFDANSCSREGFDLSKGQKIGILKLGRNIPWGKWEKREERGVE